MENSKQLTDLSPFIIDVQGQKFIKLNGLLARMHDLGVKQCVPEMLSSPNDLTNPVFKTTVIMEDGRVFVGHGDANVNNVAKKVAGALVRMAESRSVARALRFACNIPYTAVEEIDVEEEHTPTPTKSFNTSKSFNTRMDVKSDSALILDKSSVSEKVTAFNKLTEGTTTETPVGEVVSTTFTVPVQNKSTFVKRKFNGTANT